MTHYYIRKPSAVAVIAFPTRGRIILLKQTRPSTKTTLLELPGGRIERGEKPREAARRELLEETGYMAESCNFVCKFAPLPSVCDEILFVFIATQLVQIKKLIDRIDLGAQYTVPILQAVKKALANEMSAPDALALLRWKHREH
jgi:ADP-ribose pyrophosphatase